MATLSISAFYRTWLPCVAHYTYSQQGQGRDWFSPITYVKGNVQPWKKGEVVEVGTATLSFRDYQTAYIKKEPEFDLTDLPEDAVFTRLYFYLEDKWFASLQTQNWTRANKAVKHYKHFISAQQGLDVIPNVGVPTPFGELVDEFDSIVRELQQVTPIIQEQLD